MRQPHGPVDQKVAETECISVPEVDSICLEPPDPDEDFFLHPVDECGPTLDSVAE